MVKNKHFLIIVIGVVLSLLTFSGCGENSVKNLDQFNIVNTTISSTAIQNKAYLNSVDSYYDKNNNYYIFYLGSLMDVPLEDTDSYFKYSGGVIEHEFTTAKISAKTIQTNSQKTTSYSVNWQKNNEAGVSIGIGQKDTWNVAMSAKLNYSMGITDTTVWSNSFTQGESLSESTEHKIIVKFNENSKIGYYRYLMLGKLDVYAMVIKNKSTGQLSATTYTELKSCGYSFEYSADSEVFGKISEEKLEFDLSAISNLPEPVISIKEAFELEEKTFELSYNKNLYVEHGKSHEILLEFDKSDLKKYANVGYDKIHIVSTMSIKCDPYFGNWQHAVFDINYKTTSNKNLFKDSNIDTQNETTIVHSKSFDISIKDFLDSNGLVVQFVNTDNACSGTIINFKLNCSLM